ncbi:uncharacterized protein TM35_000202400 [Trypanosoma theileri]|uniref:Uncharacterized protein n=1 Tax=Trypanosoma theileri TaxID=67003 RepID=A0A1X0NTA2_9TRYP|nr:uncharacterized protein TM35_000202400 [Trypanosoma theileri]ORC87831.1 hypothetical protein TM35_000202400 [Trypanosoma theileri]
MPCSKEELADSIRELLAAKGINSARVNIEIFPQSQTTENGVSVQRSRVSISIQEKSDEPGQPLLDYQPRDPLMKPWTFQEQSEYSTQSRTVTTASVPWLEKKNNIEQQQENEALDETARPSDGSKRPSATVPFTTPMGRNSTDTSAKPSQSQLSQPSQRSQPVYPHPPDVRRDSRNSQFSGSQGGPSSRTSSVVVLEDNTRKVPEYSPVFAAATPASCLSTHNPEPTAPNERSTSSSSRKSSSVQLVESQPLREPKHQPYLGDSEGARQPSILLSSTSLKTSQNERSSRGSHGDGEALKLPPVNERKRSGTSPLTTNKVSNKPPSHSGNNVIINKPNRAATPPKMETPQKNSKQRLQEMLEEQRRMEQMSVQSRARHEELLQEAEKYLQELQEATGSTSPAAAPGSPAARVEFRTARSVSPRGTPNSDTFPHAAPRSPSAHSLNGGIKVVKFTLPQDGKAKDEAVTQLSSSPGGARHLSSKDKFSTLLREQEKMLRANNASEQEYQKLLEQAIEYHKQQKYIKELEKQHGENMEELERDAYQESAVEIRERGY